jgi:hypothetical protein
MRAIVSIYTSKLRRILVPLAFWRVKKQNNQRLPFVFACGEKQSRRVSFTPILGEDVAWDEAWESLGAGEYLMEWALV